jgi:hypothetical protein
MGQKQSRAVDVGDDTLLTEAFLNAADALADGNSAAEVVEKKKSRRQKAGQPANSVEQQLQELAAGWVSDEASHTLVRTPSVQRDIEAAAAAEPGLRLSRVHHRAARAQFMRARRRAVEARVAELQWQVQRAALLRGPSGRNFECDADCIVGGCGEMFAEEEGVRCGSGGGEGCGLFLCFACFGSTVVKNECQVGGRFDSEVRGQGQGDGDGAAASGTAPSPLSAAGSLPCPLFPQSCSCGHIPLHVIQRAMLHRMNRGQDGEAEDIHSSGHSPHKTFLLARRRWAEAQVEGVRAACAEPCALSQQPIDGLICFGSKRVSLRESNARLH